MLGWAREWGWRTKRERKKNSGSASTGLGRATGGRSFSRRHHTPRRRSRHPLAGRSNGRRGHGHTAALYLCTRVCSKGKAGPENVTTSKLQGALPSPHNNKSPHPKGKAGLQNVPTSKFQGALPAPHKHKSPQPKGKVGPDLSKTSKLPDDLPPPPLDMPPHRTRSPSPSGAR